MSSSPWDGALGKGDEDVAAPALGWRGDVLIAVGRALGKGDEDVAAPALGWGGDVLIAVGRALGKGDEDVAAPALGWRGDVLIAVGWGFGKGRRGRRRPGSGMGRRCPHRRWMGLWDGATRTSPPRPWDGEAMSSSPLGGALGKGDEDVAAPALGWRGDVLIAVGRGLGCGDEDVAAPAWEGVADNALGRRWGVP
jgi:hypothetical protein